MEKEDCDKDRQEGHRYLHYNGNRICLSVFRLIVTELVTFLVVESIMETSVCGGLLH